MQARPRRRREDRDDDDRDPDEADHAQRDRRAAAGPRDRWELAQVHARNGRRLARGRHRREGGSGHRVSTHGWSAGSTRAPMTERARGRSLSHDHERPRSRRGRPRPSGRSADGTRRSASAACARPTAASRRRSTASTSTVRRGEVLALLGPERRRQDHARRDPRGPPHAPTPARSRVLGFDPAKRERAFRDRIGIVLQEEGLDPTLTVREAVELYSAAYPRPARRRRGARAGRPRPTARTSARRRCPAASAAGSTSRSASPATPS